MTYAIIELLAYVAQLSVAVVLLAMLVTGTVTLPSLALLAAIYFFLGTIARLASKGWD